MELGPNTKKIPQNSGKQIRIPEGIRICSLISLRSKDQKLQLYRINVPILNETSPLLTTYVHSGPQEFVVSQSMENVVTEKLGHQPPEKGLV